MASFVRDGIIQSHCVGSFIAATMRLILSTFIMSLIWTRERVESSRYHQSTFSMKFHGDRNAIIEPPMINVACFNEECTDRTSKSIRIYLLVRYIFLY